MTVMQSRCGWLGRLPLTPRWLLKIAFGYTGRVEWANSCVMLTVPRDTAAAAFIYQPRGKRKTDPLSSIGVLC